MQARTDAESVVLLKQKSMSPVINYYKVRSPIAFIFVLTSSVEVI